MKPAHRGLKIYAALTWDRGFELLHRAQRQREAAETRSYALSVLVVAEWLYRD
jgi:hypothetical protein